MENPCYNPKTQEDCPRRKPGCGAHCKEWARYIIKRDKIYDDRRDYNDTESYHIDKVNRRRNKYFKKK